jgi:hypothetical protein
MNISSPAEDKIIVELTEQDMLGLEITYEEMDYSTIETRRVIWTLLDEAGKALGRELDPTRRMVIEASPKNGGCVLSFTILDDRKRYLPRKQLLKKQSRNIICDFDCVDSLYKAAEVLRLNNCIESSLYELGGKYRLVVNASDNPALIRSLLSEFGSVENACPLLCDYTKEHWRELIAENAVSLL